MLKYKQIWHGIKPTRWLIKFNLTGLTFVLQCDHRKAYVQSLEGSHIHVLLEGEVPNETGNWGNKRGSGAGVRMLPGSLSIKRKPYIDN